ncbi:hypothetical protein ACFRMO_08070 [Streptomyces anulatus]|uniref:hypothetical protein n=1 Tax=Streptomyces anulatus TaxID=1892 RepID=UPI0036C41516
MEQIDDQLDSIAEGPAGLPYAYGLNAEPITLRAATELYENLDARTLHRTELRLPDGREAVVRTICLVFEHRLATCAAAELPPGYLPQVFGSALYLADERQRFLGALWTYGLPAEARAGHAEAVDEYASGRASVAGKEHAMPTQPVLQ